MYNIGGNSEFSNLKIVREITEILDEVNPRKDGCSYFDQVRFVKDRPGHDFRYAINSNKIFKELGWRPSYSFHTGLRETVVWYLNNPRWIKNVKNKHYSDSVSYTHLLSAQGLSWMRKSLNMTSSSPITQWLDPG